MSRFAKVAAISIGIAMTMGIVGCSSFSEGFAEGMEQSKSTPAPKQTSDPSAPAPEVTPPTSTIPVSEEDLALASSSTVPLIAIAGRYIVVEGYKYFDTLTVLEFSTGERAYFATDQGHPFGSINAGLSIAADQYSREITGFGEAVPADGLAGLDAARMLSDHKEELG